MLLRDWFLITSHFKATVQAYIKNDPAFASRTAKRHSPLEGESVS